MQIVKVHSFLPDSPTAKSVYNNCPCCMQIVIPYDIIFKCHIEKDPVKTIHAGKCASVGEMGTHAPLPGE